LIFLVKKHISSTMISILWCRWSTGVCQHLAYGWECLGARVALDESLDLGQGILVPFEESEGLDGVLAVDALDGLHARVLDSFHVFYFGHVLGVVHAVHLVETPMDVVRSRPVGREGASTTSASDVSVAPIGFLSVEDPLPLRVELDSTLRALDPLGVAPPPVLVLAVVEEPQQLAPLGVTRRHGVGLGMWGLVLRENHRLQAHSLHVVRHPGVAGAAYSAKSACVEGTRIRELGNTVVFHVDWRLEPLEATPALNSVVTSRDDHLRRRWLQRRLCLYNPSLFGGGRGGAARRRRRHNPSDALAVFHSNMFNVANLTGLGTS